MEEDDDAWFGLAHLGTAANASLAKIVATFGPQAAFDRCIGEPRWRERLAAIDLDDERERAHQLGVRVITRNSELWPTQLAHLGEREPFALWLLGTAELRLTALQSIAVVGARDATRYGLDVTHQFAAELSLRDWTVASGGAFGIDAAAHRGALAVDRPTICVVAGGVDVVYPAAHHALFDAIAGCGVIVSEAPLGTTIRRESFLPRNRLIAALSRATVVVESALRSGSLNTAREAAALNRVVCAVPGSVYSTQSAGCHLLIRDERAFLTASVNEILEHLGGPLAA